MSDKRALRIEVDSLKKRLGSTGSPDSIIRVYLRGLPPEHCHKLASMFAYLAGDNWFAAKTQEYLKDSALISSLRGYLYVMKTFSPETEMREAAQWILDNDPLVVFALRTSS